MVPMIKPSRTKIFMMLARGRPHGAQDGDILVFLHDHHDQGSGDIEGGDQNDDRQDDEKPELLQFERGQEGTEKILPGAHRHKGNEIRGAAHAATGLA